MLKRAFVLLDWCWRFSNGCSASAQKVRGYRHRDPHWTMGAAEPDRRSMGICCQRNRLLCKIVNEEGGIHGRKLKYFLRDDSYHGEKKPFQGVLEQIGVFAVASLGLQQVYLKGLIYGKQGHLVGPAPEFTNGLLQFKNTSSPSIPVWRWGINLTGIFMKNWV